MEECKRLENAILGMEHLAGILQWFLAQWTPVCCNLPVKLCLPAQVLRARIASGASARVMVSFGIVGGRFATLV